MGGIKTSIGLILFFTFQISACDRIPAAEPNKLKTEETMNSGNVVFTDTAIFGAGCFWCVEAVFQDLDGVLEVQSGYTGGKMLNPDYKSVCSGLTGHAEVARIVYDSTKINFETLLEVFWQTHDPTTLNRQGADVGSQYRSVIYYLNEKQKELADFYKAKLDASGAFDKPIVTEITAFDEKFYPAEDYHQNYYNENPEQGYCRMVIKPKVDKFRKAFSEKLKK
jgi:peptide-methionine (S)-S-oxide reductase